MAIGAVIGAAVSVAVYVGVSYITDQKITNGGLAGAALSGAITGAVSGVAGPVAGTMMKMAGIAVTTSSLTVGTALVNGVVGAAAYVESTALQNAIDVPAGEEPVPVTALGIATAGMASGAASALDEPMRGMYSIAQAQYFASGRTVNSMFSPSAVSNIYKPIVQSGSLGDTTMTLIQPILLPQESSGCEYNDLGFADDPVCLMQ